MSIRVVFPREMPASAVIVLRVVPLFHIESIFEMLHQVAIVRAEDQSALSEGQDGVPGEGPDFLFRTPMQQPFVGFAVMMKAFEPTQTAPVPEEKPPFRQRQFLHVYRPVHAFHRIILPQRCP